MNNTIQLYTDREKSRKGYPITTPDRVLDENGKSIKKHLNNNVKFRVVEEEGEEAPPINNGNNDDNDIGINNSELSEEIERLNRKIENVKEQLTRKADKDGSLQTNLNAEKVGGKLVDELALRTELNNKADKDGRLQVGLNSEKVGGKLVSELALKDGNLQTNLNAQKVGGKTVDELALKDRNLQVGLNAQMIDGKTVDKLALKTELDTVKEKVNEINIDKNKIPMLDDTTGKIPASKLDKGFDILAKDERDLTLNNLDLKKYSHLEIGLGAWREVLIQINEVTIGSIQGSANTTKGFIGCLSSNGCFYYHDHDYRGTLHIVSESANILDGPNNTLKIVGRPAHSSDEGWVQEGMADDIYIIGVK